jgi:hypothetical protein
LEVAVGTGRSWLRIGTCSRCTAAYRLIVRPLTHPPRWFRPSYFRRQVPPCPYDATEILAAKGGSVGENVGW